MDNRNYKYDAFISYRHCELDKFVAENLHRLLETYNLPKEIKKKLNIKNKAFERVFRDQEELPLTSNLEDPIISALKESKYLIVICSPRLNKSLWCKKEIETFKKLRGRKNIFCVLVEGEPKDSFPNEVLHDEDGNLIEPLAADVRGKDKKEVLKKLKEEKLRLIAPMYNLDYDDLRQRHKLRKQKRTINTLIIVLISLFLFTIYSLAMFIKINTQQNILALHQALSLASNSQDYLSKDRVSDAVKTSYQALTEFEDVEMPYTHEAEYALSESLGIYDIGSSYKAISELQTNGIVDYIKNSDNNKIIAIYDESDEITLFESKTLNIIKKYNVKDTYTSEYSFSFIGNDLFSFINDKGNISIVNIKGDLVKEIEKVKYSYLSLKGDSKGEYLLYTDSNNLYIYNIKEDKIINVINTKEKYLKNIYFNEENNYIFAFTQEENFDINKEDYTTIHVISLDGKELNSVKLNAGYVSGVITKENNAFFLLNRSISNKYNMLVVNYDYINGSIKWNKSFENNWGSFITKSYPSNTNDIAVVNYDNVYVLNCDNGDIIESFNTNSEVINIYSYLNKEVYLVFLSNGSVNFINMQYKNNVEYKGKFELNIKDYIKVAQSENGFILIPKNDNRIVLYEEKYNPNMVKEDIKLDYIADDSIPLKDYEIVKEEYKIQNKSLVEKIFYDTDKEIMFVNYSNNDVSIYDVKSKKLLNKINNLGKVYHYFGKDSDNRIYIGELSDSYILDKNYNKVGHIKSLCKLEKDKVIILYNDEYYSLKIYKLKDLLKEAELYLNNLGLLDEN